MTSLNPLYTVGNQLVESIQAHSNVSHHQALRKAREVMDLVKIPDIECKMNYYPHEFSGGMKQRAVIAMALATGAEIIIADEPTTALDVTIQAQIMKLLNEIKQNNQTSILLITHDLALVSENSQNIAVMYAGRIVEYASTQAFFSNPNHPYSKALLKSIPSSEYSKLETIKGQPPALSQTIEGCRFHPRCDYCMEKCRLDIPLLKEIIPNHYSACFLNGN